MSKILVAYFSASGIIDDAAIAADVLSKQNALRGITVKHQWKSGRKCCTLRKR